jgi:hypothetical protein
VRRSIEQSGDMRHRSKQVRHILIQLTQPGSEAMRLMNYIVSKRPASNSTSSFSSSLSSTSSLSGVPSRPQFFNFSTRVAVSNPLIEISASQLPLIGKDRPNARNDLRTTCCLSLQNRSQASPTTQVVSTRLLPTSLPSNLFLTCSLSKISRFSSIVS